MKIGLVGFAGSGKSTVFQWLTGDKPDKERELDQFEQSVLQRIIAALEAGQMPRTLALKPDEEKAIRSFQLLTLKPEIVFVNQGEGGQALPADLLALAPNALAAPAK